MQLSVGFNLPQRARPRAAKRRPVEVQKGLRRAPPSFPEYEDSRALGSAFPSDAVKSFGETARETQRLAEGVASEAGSAILTLPAPSRLQCKEHAHHESGAASGPLFL